MLFRSNDGLGGGVFSPSLCIPNMDTGIVPKAEVVAAGPPKALPNPDLTAADVVANSNPPPNPAPNPFDAVDANPLPKTVANGLAVVSLDGFLIFTIFRVANVAASARGKLPVGVCSVLSMG